MSANREFQTSSVADEVERIKQIEVDGARMAVDDVGSGEPVILFHSSMASSAQWTSLSERLAANFRVLAPDQWSCGNSDPWAGAEPFTLDAEAQPVVRLIDQIGQRVHLVGHSYGGAVAIKVASLCAGAVASLCLIEPSCFHLLRQNRRDHGKYFDEISRVAADVGEAVLDGHHQAGLERFVDYWNGPGAWSGLSLAAQQKLASRLAKVPLDFHALFNEETGIPEYARIGAPTLIMRGNLSPAPSLRIVEILIDSMPHCDVRVIDGAGHMSPLTHTDIVNDAIADHLDDTMPARAVAA